MKHNNNYLLLHFIVIDLDDIWKWLGFSQKANVKKIIDRTFIIDINYKMMLCQWQKQRLLYLN